MIHVVSPATLRPGDILWESCFGQQFHIVIASDDVQYVTQRLQASQRGVEFRKRERLIFDAASKATAARPQ